MSAGVDRALLYPENDLLAIYLANQSLIVYDLKCRRIARVFDNAHRLSVTDMTFGNGGRWLVSASHDGTVKIWDLAGAALIDVLLMRTVRNFVEICCFSSF